MLIPTAANRLTALVVGGALVLAGLVLVAVVNRGGRASGRAMILPIAVLVAGAVLIDALIRSS